MSEELKWVTEMIIIPLIVAMWVSLKEGQKQANAAVREKIDEIAKWIDSLEERVNEKVSFDVFKESMSQQYRELITILNMADDAQMKKDLQVLRERVAVLEAELNKEK